MLRFSMRMIGFFFFAGSFSALIVDGTRSMAAHHLMTFSLAETCGWLFPASMARLSASVDQGPLIARFALTQLLWLPTWFATAVVGLLLFLAGRRRRDRFGPFVGR